MTHYLDPEKVKHQTTATQPEVRCGTCVRTRRDSCSHVDCPHRRPAVHIPDTDGAIPIRRPPGSYDWRDDR